MRSGASTGSTPSQISGPDTWPSATPSLKSLCHWWNLERQQGTLLCFSEVTKLSMPPILSVAQGRRCFCFVSCFFLFFFVPVPLEWASLAMFNNIILFVTRLKVKRRSILKTCTYFCVFQRHGQSSPSEPAHLKIRTISYCNKILVPFHSLYLTILIYL